MKRKSPISLPSLSFLGGAGTVTGSKFLLERNGYRVLVDCGLFQGLKELRLRNRAPLPFEAPSIDAVILTHAHLDHSGALPLVRKSGYRGPVYCTPPTATLSRIVLLDSAKIQEEDASDAKQGGYSKHADPQPLYDTEAALAATELFQTLPLHQWNRLHRDLEFRFLDAGHILGSTIVQIRCPEFTLTFTGDLGRADPLLLHRPEIVEETDYLVMESTYGDRVHSSQLPLDGLAAVIQKTYDRGGHLIIPAFSIGRTQDLIHLIDALRREKRIPDLPLYLDSPMGIEATSAFAKHPGWHRLKPQELDRLQRSVRLVRTHWESIGLLKAEESTIVIAGSGMVTGGRVLGHLAERLPDPKNTVLLVGYQAAGTRGSQLLAGSPQVKIHGKYVDCRAEIASIPALSAHADQRELLDWASRIQRPPRTTFIVHGEPQASDTLRVLLRDRLNHHPVIPSDGQRFELL